MAASSEDDTRGALRIGVVLDESGQLQRWERRLLSAIVADPRLELAALIVDARPLAPPRTSVLHHAVAALDAALFARGHDAPASFDAVAPTRLHVDPTDALAEHELDVVLDHRGFSAPALGARAARMGVWSYGLAAVPPHGAGDALAIPAVSTNAEALRVALYARVDDAAPPQPIAAAAFNTKASAARLAAFARDKLDLLIVRELRRRAIGADAPALEDDAPSYPQSAAISNAQALSYFFKLGWGVASRIAGAAAEAIGRPYGAFTLMRGEGDIATADFSQARPVSSPGAFIWADPFLFEHEGATYVFFENVPKGETRGHISVGRLEPGDGFTFLGDALKRPHHLSYPYVFAGDGEIYMIPETNEAKRIEVWRAVSFPLEWELCATALEGVYSADTVLARRGEEWWLFSNLSHGDIQDHCAELHVFRADGPTLGELTPHALNPVILDTRCARNGGRVFEKDGALMRVSQSNAYGRYGYGFNLGVIEALDLETYRERIVRRVTPEAVGKVIGCHHLDAVGETYILDVRHGVRLFS